MQFNYNSFVYDTLDKKGDKLSSLQHLVVRKVPMVEPPHADNPSPLEMTQWDRYTHLYHGVLQLPSLTELDLSDNNIHKELQPQLQVMIKRAIAIIIEKL